MSCLSGTIGHVAHGKSTVVKAISGVQVIRCFRFAFDTARIFSVYFRVDIVKTRMLVFPLTRV